MFETAGPKTNGRHERMRLTAPACIAASEIASRRGVSLTRSTICVGSSGSVDTRRVRDHPFCEPANGAQELSSKFCERVFDLRWLGRRYRSRDEAAFFEIAQRRGQYLLADFSNLASQGVEAARAASKHAHNEHRPLVTDAGERVDDVLAVGGI